MPTPQMIDVINVSNPLTLTDALAFLERERKYPNRPFLFVYVRDAPREKDHRGFVVARHVMTIDDHAFLEQTKQDRKRHSRDAVWCSRIDPFNIVTLEDTK